jgi:fatty-acyl-CoA synthase
MSVEPNPALDVSTLPALLAHWRAMTPDADAAIEAGRRLSYAQLSDAVEHRARALIGAGVQHGDRVAMLAPPGLAFWINFLASAEIGAIWVGLNPRYADKELSEVVARVAPRVLVASNECDGRDYRPWLKSQGDDIRVLAPEVSFDEDALAPPILYRARRVLIGPNDACLIVFTSGSTGAPKAVVMRQGALVGASLIQANIWSAQPLRVLNNLPINHIGCVGDLGVYTLAGGGTLVFAARFDPKQTLDLIEHHRISVWGQVPTMFQLTLDAEGFDPKRLASLQRIFWGGAQASPELVRRLSQLGPALATSYGQTETVGSIAFTPETASEHLLARSVGRAVAPYEVRIAGDGEEGEIEVRTPFGMSGYWNGDAIEPLDMIAAWRGTGDIGSISTDGDISLLGRVHDVFKSGGYNIYPGEIEAALEAHPGVRQAALVGVEDQLYGHAGWAFLVTENEAPDAQDLRAHLSAHIANYKIPKRFVFVDALPLLAVGKVDKKQLRERARGLS